MPHSTVVAVLVATLAPLAALRAQDEPRQPGTAPDVAHIPSRDLLVEGEPLKRCFLIPPKAEKPPKAGYKLLLVLPGGDGAATFHDFVKRIRDNALSDEWIVAQLVAPVWNERQAQEVVWPTAAARKRLPDLRFTTEQVVDEIIAGVDAEYPLDGRHVYTLGWSSGGPACYAISLRKKTRVTGSFIAMSVFHEKEPGLDAAAGHAYFLLHSPEDWIKISFAEAARDELAAAGAKTKLVTYEGGHGWHGNVFGYLRQGIAWLTEQNAKRKAPKAVKGKRVKFTERS